MRQSKIIATIGPASSSPEILGQLIDAGVDVMRLNFSHGTHESHAAALRGIRDQSARRGVHVAVMGDLSGPKIRLGRVAGGSRAIFAGDSLTITRHSHPAAPAVGTNLDSFVDDVAVGHHVLIDDGQVRLTVTAKSADAVTCVCDVGGTLSDHKGVNLPDTRLSLESLTEKDLRDLEWAVENELDYVALSFVRRARDLDEARERMDGLGRRIPLVAKIETPAAIENISEIIDACDALLVARGDLGVEMDVAQVPLLQKRIVRQCLYAGRPVIVATQMLQSMIDQPTPTRAEVSDVANAILDGADAVMLSAETAVGRFPVEAVQMMSRIAEQTEPLLHRQRAAVNLEVFAASMRVTSSVARGAALLARDLSAKLVAVWTKVGNTPRLLSKHRFDMPIIGVAADAAIARRLALLNGVLPLVIEPAGDDSAMIGKLDQALRERHLAQPGDMSILIMGTQLTRPGSTNSLLIHLVGEG